MAHLTGFGLENFRVFKDYTWFDFAPITILVGPNSSGKSSLIKALLLMQDNIQEGKVPDFRDVIGVKGPVSTDLDFSGVLHNLGNPKLVTSNNSDSNIFTYVIPVNTKKSADMPLSPFVSVEEFDGEFINFTQPLYRRFDFVVEEGKAINLYQENLVLADLTPIYTRRNFSHVYLNLPLLVNLIEQPKSDQQIMSAINVLSTFLKQINPFSDLDIYEGEENKFYEVDLWDKYEVNEFKYNDYSPFGFDEGKVTCKGKKYQLPNQWQYSFDEPNCIRDYLSIIFPDYEDIKEVSDAICFLLRYNSIKDTQFTKGRREHGYHINWSKLRYLPSIKGVQRRTYQVGDDNFLNTLINETEQRNTTMKSHEDFKVRWERKFNMGDIKIEKNDKLNLKYIEVGGRSLADLGYGYMQLTALLLTILSEGKYKQNFIEDKIKQDFNLIEKHPFWSQEWDFKYKQIILEEPEANLHPKFQSQLADLINDARINLKIMNHFIIETHSEYMIRKFQYLVAKGEMKPEDIVIYYFNDPNNVPAGEKQIKKITIEEDGSLSDDFGPGFYDEADNLAISLFNLQKSRRN